MTVTSFKLASVGRSDRRKRINEFYSNMSENRQTISHAVTVCKRIERSYSDASENRQMISRAVAIPSIFIRDEKSNS